MTDISFFENVRTGGQACARAVAAVALAAAVSAASADEAAMTKARAKVARVFADNMVLQREKPVRIWGWAQNGTKIAVAFDGQVKETVAADGKWSATLDPMKASKVGRELKVSVNGQDGVSITNVLVGEVWILSGQSNMQWSMTGTDDYTNALKRADYPTMRYMFGQDGALATAPADDFPDVKWVETKPGVLGRYSGTGFYFGERIMLDLDVPVGLVMTACGATSMANWTPYDWMAKLPYQKRYLERYERESAEWVRTNGFAGACRAHAKAVEKYAEDVFKAKTGKGKWPWPPPGVPLAFTGWRSNLVPALHYNSKIAPLAGFSCRGVLWFQGETEGWCWNERDPGWNFGDMLELMIKSWRAAWGEDLWFVIAQLPSMAANNHGRPVIRVKQREVSKRLSNVGVANITDTGWKDDVHPHDKKPVGERLARVARRRVYGDKSVALTPEYESAEFQPGRAVVTFASETKLFAKGEGIGRGFELKVAGKWSPAAKAELVDGKAVVSAADPAAKVEGVRYLWDSWDKPNVWIYDEQGVPVNSFSEPFEIQ